MQNQTTAIAIKLMPIPACSVKVALVPGEMTEISSGNNLKLLNESMTATGIKYSTLEYLSMPVVWL